MLEKVGRLETRLESLAGSYFSTEMFHEASAQRRGVITRSERPTYQPVNVNEVVVSGPLIQVGRPWSKTPNTICSTNKSYQDVDLTIVENGYIPRTVYRAGSVDGSLAEFLKAIDEWPKPCLPGFWPVSAEEIEGYEAICGEKLRLYDASHGTSERRFAYFELAQGPVVDAVQWIQKKRDRTFDGEYMRRFGSVWLRQGRPSNSTIAQMPRPITSYFRFACRKMGQPGNERTLIPAIIPAGASHIDGLFSVATANERHILILTGSAASIVCDFYIRQTGKTNIRDNVIRHLPLVSGKAEELVIGRTLRLVSVTSHYACLWERNFAEDMRADAWAFEDPRFVHEYELQWSELPPLWERGCALRSDIARRQALLEIDVLVAQAFDLTLDELLTIYRVQFPVMRQYENADEYDAMGRRLPNTARKDPGAKELRAARERHDGTSPITVSWPVDNGNATVTKTFHPPFTRVDREDDYRRAWAAFEKRLGQTAVGN